MKNGKLKKLVYDSPITCRGTKRKKVYAKCGEIARKIALREFSEQKEPINTIERVKPFNRKLPPIRRGSQESEYILSVLEHRDAALSYIKYIL